MERKPIIESAKCDVILKASLMRKEEKISSDSILAILNKMPNSEFVNKDEIELFIKFLDTNKKDEIAETIVRPKKIQIKANNITESFLKKGGFTEIEKSINRKEQKEIAREELEDKHKIWSYKSRFFPLLISGLALFISFITIGLKIYETMYPKESEEIKTMKEEIKQLKLHESLLHLKPNLKK